ncbi:MAG: Fic family protein [Flavobacteriales bacterium]|nr:Fic family protein [Flavobacteriales bacterium]
MKSTEIQLLPLKKDLETKKVLKKLNLAHRALAELKGLVFSIPNENILINTLALQEAKDSSAIENIITTHDDLYKEGLQLQKINSPQAKEVQNYITALKKGFALLKENNIISNNHIIEIQSVLENNNAGFRKTPGTALKNAQTGEVIYTPPQDITTIKKLMVNLEKFINNDESSDLDPIVKMAIIHYQFESIHPFYDGNGRTGRILNVLYLVNQNLLDLPILYMSKFIIHNKTDYYKLLQTIRETDEWEKWILYMIESVTETANQSMFIIKEIKRLMQEFKVTLREEYKFYSQDLLNNLFKHPYTKIELIQKDLGVSRITAASYLNKLAKDGLLKKQKMGTGNYYVNQKLFELLT